MMDPVYRWNGEYFGFIDNNKLFDKYSRYLGWIDSGEVWKADGTYLGAIYKDNYILRQISAKSKPSRFPRAHESSPPIPEERMNRIAKTSREGFRDALDEF